MKKMKVAAVALTSLMLFSTTMGITGCNKKGGSKAVQNSVRTVEADSVWFDCKENLIKIFEDESKFDFINMNTNMIKTDSGFVTSAVGYPKNWETDTSENLIILFDEAGEVKEKISINAKDFDLPKDAEVYCNSLVSYGGNTIAVIGSYIYDEETMESTNETFFYNIDTKEVGTTEHLKEPKSDGIQDAGITQSGYEYAVNCTWGKDKATYSIVFGKNGKKTGSLDLTKEIKDSLYGCYFMDEKDGKLVLNAYGDNADLIITVDPEDLSFETKTWDEYYNHSDSEEDSDMYYETFTADDGTVYVAKDDGIYCDGEVVLPYTATYCNASMLAYPTIISADGDHFVLLISDYSSDKMEYKMYSFDRADSNPNAGKKIIDVGYIEYLDDNAAEAACNFNQENSDYFVNFVKYDRDYETAYKDAEEEDDYTSAGLKMESDLANELMMDLLGGEGPDIILNAYNLTQMSTDDYLIDMSDFVNTEMKDMNLFDNVIEACKDGDKLYQIPLTFAVDGIIAKPSDVKGDTGFTFDEYKEYVDKVCNGRNPLTQYQTRLQVMNNLIAASSDKYFDDKGNVNFKNDDFYELAAYCKDNVPETFDWDSEEEYGIYESSVGVGYGPIGAAEAANQRVSLWSIDSYFNISSGNYGFYGLPSSDGRGPVIVIESSIAISAAAADEDGAKEFVKYLVNGAQNVQYTNSISVDATVALSKKTIDNNNENYKNALSYETPEELHSYGMREYDYDIIDDYVAVLKTASTVSNLDTSIQLIVVEEIPAYFAGQKTIEEVADVIQNRAQTVVNERG